MNGKRSSSFKLRERGFDDVEVRYNNVVGMQHVLWGLQRVYLVWKDVVEV